MAIRTAVNRALTAITALPTAAALVDGNLTLLTTATASSSATLDFTSGIDSTYDSYVFKFYNMHPATDADYFSFNMSIDTGSNYNVAKVSTHVYAAHGEGDSPAAVGYDTGVDNHPDFTPNISLGPSVGNDNDQAASGSMTLFNPSSTTFVKHFISEIQEAHSDDLAVRTFTGGYVNSTSAVDAVQFKYNSGNIDSGVIKLYGIGPKQ
jgi:hypothetical protein